LTRSRWDMYSSASCQLCRHDEQHFAAYGDYVWNWTAVSKIIRDRNKERRTYLGIQRALIYSICHLDVARRHTPSNNDGN
jgi:hypothetical protein